VQSQTRKDGELKVHDDHKNERVMKHDYSISPISND
jgi:hypothetical protein